MTITYADALAAVEHLPSCRSEKVGTFTGREGDKVARCATCGATAVLEERPAPPARYRLDCVRCDAVIHRDNPRPVVPLCRNCKRTAERHRRPGAGER